MARSPLERDDLEVDLQGRDVASVKLARLVDELANPLVAWPRDSEPLCLGADPAVDLGDRNGLPGETVDLVEQPE